MLKFQAVAEKTAKNFRGLLFLPHPVHPSVYGYNVITSVSAIRPIERVSCTV